MLLLSFHIWNFCHSFVTRTLTDNPITMSGFPFNERKALAAVLFVLKEMGGKVDKHKLAKILYYADEKHLCRYARPVTGDRYIAMPYGPVPSGVYDGVKKNACFPLFRDTLDSDGNAVMSDQEPNMKLLSKTDVECLCESIHENKDLSFWDLVNKSHKEAYNNACGGTISVLDMAKEAGASEGMIEYINELMSDYQPIC